LDFGAGGFATALVGLFFDGLDFGVVFLGGMVGDFSMRLGML